MSKKLIMPAGSKALNTNEMREVEGGKRVAFVNNDICKKVVSTVFGTTEGVTKGMIIDKIDVFANFLVEQIPSLEQFVSMAITTYSADFADSLVEVCGSDEMGLAIDVGFPTLVDFSAQLPAVTE
ncbi:MAG: hypothetical protein E7262_10040 [Lachnospiraceae bacterium]|nr:hypothetical protein [Lachnospiraceae bacterium]